MMFGDNLNMRGDLDSMFQDLLMIDEDHDITAFSYGYAGMSGDENPNRRMKKITERNYWAAEDMMELYE